MIQFQEDKQLKKIAEIRKKEEEEAIGLLSQKYGIPYINLAIVPINSDALKLVDEEDAKSAHMAVFQKIGKRLQIAVKNPGDKNLLAILEKLKADRYEYELFLASTASIEKAWDTYKQIITELKSITGELTISPEQIEKFKNQVKTLLDIKDLVETVIHKRITDLLEIMIAGALKTEASDIHVEPQAEEVRIRYRLDGMLNDLTFINRKTYVFLLSRIKLVSEMKLNIHERGQDGRFTIKTDGIDIEVRASVLPGPYGENIVLRILNPKTIGLQFEELGMQPWVEEVVAREIQRPNGMIITTGPTGSGKTTTLYAFLKKVHTEDIKIITLEDPIEYHLVGIEQTQVDEGSGYSFPEGLRSILRQDPDIILVGEIRDMETAETAMHASLTGHLVFSTLHTNDAAGTIPRLVDIGVRPNIIAPAINVAIAQRLVRKLCPVCKITHTPSPKEIETIKKELDTLPEHIEKPSLSKINFYSPKENGCAACNFTGYKGRIGIFEVLLIDDEMETLILKSPSEAEIKNIMKKQGQITIKQDGVLKVIKGVTDINEVERIVG